MTDREVRVKLVADVDEYVAAMKKARRVTRWADPRIAERVAFSLVGASVGMIVAAAVMFLGSR